MPQRENNQLHIGMLLDGFYPSDIRVQKEAESLITQHKVFILCCKKAGEKETEIINGVKVYRSIQYKNNAHRGIIDIRLAINFIHLYFKKELPIFIKENHINVLHVHDLPLARTGYLAAKKFQLKTVLDLHENYAAALLTWFIWRKSWIIQLKNKLFFSYGRWMRYEANIIKKYDAVIAVVEEMKERLIAKHTMDFSKITVVSNTEKKSFSLNFNDEKTDYFKEYQNRFIISYVGGFGPHRGLHTAIEAMSTIVKTIPKALLVLIGPASKDVRIYLEELVEKYALQKHVLIKGSQPYKDVIRIMSSSHINMIPHISNEHTESTIPHKLFQILLSQKPLLVSDCLPMKRVVTDNNIGTVFKAGDSYDFSKTIFEMHANYDAVLEIAKKGYDAAKNGNLNWEYSTKDLFQLYCNLAK